MRPQSARALAASALLVAAAVASAHPPGNPEHAHQPAARAWTNAATGEHVRGAYLASRDGRVTIELDDGALVAFPIADLAAPDREEVERRIAATRERNQQRALQAPAPADAPGPKPSQAGPFDLFAPSVKTRWDDRFLYVESDGLPHAPLAHPLMVGITSWQQQVPLPQTYTGANAWRIPLKPELADAPVSGKTLLRRGAIALAVNGVPIFNALNNRGDDALKAGELDEFGGHSGRADDYHYHTAPLALQKIVGPTSPIAYALDGFPIFGLFDPAAKPGDDHACPLGATDKLDELNGHFAPPPAPPGPPAPPTGSPPAARGLYHYHASLTYPYINGGVRGKVTVKDDQIDPQPRATPIRPALSPLRGATITGFASPAEKSWSLEYLVAGQKHFVDYRIDAAGKHIFDFVSPDGSKQTETFTNRDGRREGGRDGGRDGPRPLRDDRPPPPPGRGETDHPRPGPAGPQPEPDPSLKPLAGFELSSPAIGPDHRLPAEFTCDGASRSPPLKWTKPPEGTKSLAVVMHHVPGPGDTHVYWVLFNLPHTTESLETAAANLGLRGVNTINDRKEYAPPCSKGPGDKTYTITLYALSAEPKLDAAKSKVTRAALLDAIRTTTLATAKLDVVYARPAGAGGSKNDRRPAAPDVPGEERAPR